MKVKQKCRKAHIPKGFLIVVVALSAILGTVIVVADDISIRIAPSTLNLYDVEDKCVTVHAEIPFSMVNVSDLGSLTLANSSGGYVSAYDAFADTRGNLVAKFDRAAVAGIVDVAEEVTLRLTGVVSDEAGGGGFTGTDNIRVIDEGKE